ncbi:hypothetical protein LLG39_15840 [bacterium]|nr:hypothetical protein [bacterium]
MSGPAPICLYCEHLVEGEYPLRCAAFPDGIPMAIIDNLADHRQPYEGDHGTRFKPKPEVSAGEVNERYDFIFSVK